MEIRKIAEPPQEMKEMLSKQSPPKFVHEDIKKGDQVTIKMVVGKEAVPFIGKQGKLIKLPVAFDKPGIVEVEGTEVSVLRVMPVKEE